MKASFFDQISTITVIVLKFLAAVLLELFGEFTPSYRIVILLWLMDFGTGLWIGIRKHRLSSAISRTKGVPKLIGYCLLVIASFKLDQLLAASQWNEVLNLFGVNIAGFTFTSANLLFIGITEVISILENTSIITGQKIKLFNNPKKFSDLFDTDPTPEEQSVSSPPQKPE